MTVHTELTPAEAADRLALRELFDAYAHCADRRDAEGQKALFNVIGAYAVVLGIIAIGGAFWLPIGGGDTALLILSGLVSILFGIVMFAKPGDSAVVTLALIAAFALITGISELVAAIGGKRLVESDLKRAFSPQRPSKPQPSH